MWLLHPDDRKIMVKRFLENNDLALNELESNQRCDICEELFVNESYNNATIVICYDCHAVGEMLCA